MFSKKVAPNLRDGAISYVPNSGGDYFSPRASLNIIECHTLNLWVTCETALKLSLLSVAAATQEENNSIRSAPSDGSHAPHSGMLRLNRLPAQKLYVGAFKFWFFTPGPCVRCPSFPQSACVPSWDDFLEHFFLCTSVIFFPPSFSLFSVSSRRLARPHPNRRLRSPPPRLHSLRYQTFVSNTSFSACHDFLCSVNWL